jgi:Fe-S-cluster containining protein
VPNQWYKDGLRFECVRCGGCCRGEPGYVWVRGPEVAAMAQLLDMDFREFMDKYCRAAFGDVSLKELPNGDCVFWSEEGCRIYPVRPVQCRTFPFWREYVRSARSWRRAGRRCPGVGRGRLFSAEEIQQRVRETDS